MDVVEDEVSIFAMPKKFVSKFQHIKDLIIHFLSAQQYRITNKHKKLVKNSNHHHMSRWGSAHFNCFLCQQSKTEWELQAGGIAKILLKYTYPVIFNKYVVPK